MFNCPATTRVLLFTSLFQFGCLTRLPWDMEKALSRWWDWIKSFTDGILSISWNNRLIWNLLKNPTYCNTGSYSFGQSKESQNPVKKKKASARLFTCKIGIGLGKLPITSCRCSNPTVSTCQYHIQLGAMCFTIPSQPECLTSLAITLIAINGTHCRWEVTHLRCRFSTGTSVDLNLYIWANPL